MTVILKVRMPEGVPIEMLDEVTAEMGAETNPPPGLIVHTHFEKDGRVHVIDVWESAEAQTKFENERLEPAIAKVAAARGLDMAGGPLPESEFIEVHGVVRG